MKKLNPFQIIGIIGIFIGLWLGYGYFSNQALLSSGKANADTVMQMIRDGEHDVIKQRLIEYVGIPNEQAEKYERLRLALINVDYVRSIVKDDGRQATFIDGVISSKEDKPVYQGVYALPAEQDDDYVVVLFGREGDQWVLSNFILSASNPLKD